MQEKEITAGDVWKMFAETDRKMQEDRERLNRTDEELRRQREQSDKTLAELANYNRLLGKYSNKLGYMIEGIMMPGIVEKFNERGFKFNSVSTRVEFLNENRDENLAEVDALLENGKFVIAVEAKTDMCVGDVNAHIKRLKVLRTIPRFKGKKIYGALATAVARKKPVSYALAQGFYVLKQPDIGIEIIDFPKGCSAKAF